jgi:ABC-type antimicrobial peptide transport system permease subunit
MTTESASLQISALLGVSSAVLQNALPTGMSMTSLLVPIISAVVGGLMSYAVLKTTVQKMERDVRDMRKDMSDIYTLVRESLTKVAKLEGRLDSHS